MFKKIPPKYFILSQFAILLFGLLFLLALHFLVNTQYKDSPSSFSKGPVTTKPKSFTLDLTQPSDDLLTFDEQILIAGKTGPKMQILLSTQTQDVVIESKLDGTFSQSLDLKEGVNNLKVAVFDNKGDFREERRVVYYSKEKI